MPTPDAPPTEPTQHAMGSHGTGARGTGADGLRAWAAVALDVVAPLVLGVLLVRDASLLPDTGDRWLLAGFLLAPVPVARIAILARFGGDGPPPGVDLFDHHDPHRQAKLHTVAAAASAVFVVAWVGATAGIDPSAASGALSWALVRVVAKSTAGFRVGGAVGVGVGAAVVLGLAPGFAAAVTPFDETTMLVGRPMDASVYAENLVGILAAPVFVHVLLRRSQRAAHEQRRVQRAVAAERLRIARELHDVVAHQMTGVVLQARGAAAQLDVAPDRARAALETIEATSRDALDELRRLLGVLRTGPEDPGVETGAAHGAPMSPGSDPEPLDLARGAPQRSLDDIAELVRTFSRSLPPGEKASVTASFEGELQQVPAGIAASAHRIVQEALTNVARHAGRADVRITCALTGPGGGGSADAPDRAASGAPTGSSATSETKARRTAAGVAPVATSLERVLEVRVVNDAPTAPPATALPGSGLGLVGMNERAVALGGELRAGPTPDGGWEVVARIPVPRRPIGGADIGGTR